MTTDLIKAADELARRVEEREMGVPMRKHYVFDAITAYRAARERAGEVGVNGSEPADAI
jgi:hypothetical protein